MAQAINYNAIAPESDTAAKGHAKANSNFSGSGNRLVPKKGKSSVSATPAATPGTSTPALGAAASSGSSPLAIAAMKSTAKRKNGPQPLRLPPGKLFFGYEIKPVKKREDAANKEQEEKKHFAGEGQSLRKKK